MPSSAIDDTGRSCSIPGPRLRLALRNLGVDSRVDARRLAVHFIGARNRQTEQNRFISCIRVNSGNSRKNDSSAPSWPALGLRVPASRS